MVNKKEILERLRDKTEADKFISELDRDFAKARQLVDKRMAQVVQVKDGEIKYLEDYLKFLDEKIRSYSA